MSCSESSTQPPVGTDETGTCYEFSECQGDLDGTRQSHERLPTEEPEDEEDIDENNENLILLPPPSLDSTFSKENNNFEPAFNSTSYFLGDIHELEEKHLLVSPGSTPPRRESNQSELGK